MNHLFTNVDAVLFDLDGTLVETNIDFPLMKREMVRLATDHGLSHADVAGLDILAIVDRSVYHVRRQHGEDAADELREEAFLILEEIELQHAADAREIRPARELIEALRGLSIKVGIVTRNSRAASEQSLARAGIAADVLVCREDVDRTKPAPDHLLLALERLSARPERSVMIGDHRMDVAAGKAAGMRTIGLLTKEHLPDYFSPAQPDAVARDLGEILNAIINSHSQLEHERTS